MFQVRKSGHGPWLPGGPGTATPADHQPAIGTRFTIEVVPGTIADESSMASFMPDPAGPWEVERVELNGAQPDTVLVSFRALH